MGCIEDKVQSIVQTKVSIDVICSFLGDLSIIVYLYANSSFLKKKNVNLRSVSYFLHYMFQKKVSKNETSFAMRIHCRSMCLRCTIQTSEQILQIADFTTLYRPCMPRCGGRHARQSRILFPYGYVDVETGTVSTGVLPLQASET